MKSKTRNYFLWLSPAAVLIALDQLSKFWIVKNFELYERQVETSWLEIVYFCNYGAAFGLLANAPGWQKIFFSTLALVVSTYILVWLARPVNRQQRLVSWGLVFILAGALGNVIDRLFHGCVVDFIYVHWNEHYWPAFNVADSAITVGAALFIIDLIVNRKQPSSVIDETTKDSD